MRTGRRSRIIFGVYALTLTVGTHWPRLQLGTGEGPAPDKLLHAAAFGVLALLLWRTGWIRSRLLLWATVITWSVIDEASQSIPGLGRQFSLEDAFANILGVTIAVVMLWATAPLGGPVNRLYRDRITWSVERSLRRPGSVALVAAWCALLGAAGGLSTLVIASVMPAVSYLAYALLGVGIGLVLGAHTGIEFVRRLELERLAGPVCYHCGASVDGVSYDAEGFGACPCCGSMLHEGQWRPVPVIRGTLLQGAMFKSMALGVGVVMAGFGGYLALLALRPRSEFAQGVIGEYHALAEDLRLVADLGLLVLGLAVAIRLMRKRIARIVDTQHVRCVTCGHDLRATTPVRGMGTCGECGSPFLVLPDRLRSDSVGANGGPVTAGDTSTG